MTSVVSLKKEDFRSEPRKKMLRKLSQADVLLANCESLLWAQADLSFDLDSNLS